MVFNKKLAGAIVVAAALAITPAAGAAPAGPDITTGTATATQNSPSCSFLWRSAKLASDAYWFSTHGGVPLTRDAYNDLWAAYQAAVAEYERLGCRAWMGAPPEWGARP